MAKVLLRSVSKTYAGGHLAVDNFDLAIDDGEFVALVGPSGCGKTTLLRLIAGLEEMTLGEIELGGRVINQVPAKDRDIAMVFQSYALYPHMSVRDNIAFGLKMRRQPRTVIEQCVRDTSSLLGISELLDRKPKQLSGGQRQRVALGRAIVRNPKCFLFDEPLSNLDAKLRGEMRTEIKRLHLQLRTTSIYVTHDQEEAMTLGDRVVVMNHGVIQQIGAPLDVYNHPASRFVAEFLGTPRMNFLPGTLRANDGAIWFDDGSQEIPVPNPMAGYLTGSVGGQVLLGVRPQALRLESGDYRSAPIQVRVVLSEVLGDKMDVFVATAKHTEIIARVDARLQLTPGSDIRLYVNLDQLHFFSAGTGRNLVEFSPVTENVS